MALTKEMLTADEFSCPDAYIVIEQITWFKNQVQPNDSHSISMATVYKDKANRDAGKHPIARINTVFVMDVSEEAPNALAQAYLALKEKPELAEAKDV